MNSQLLKYKIPYVVAGSVIFILIRLSFAYSPDKSEWQRNLVCLSYLFSTGLSYFLTYHFIIDHYYTNKRKGLVISFAVTLVIGTLLLTGNYFILKDGTIRFEHQYWSIFNVITSSYFVVMLAAIAAAALRMVIDHNKTVLELQTTQKEKIRNELDFLKAQINPHFIFNCINSIYVQVDMDASKAKATLSSFSELLRYQLYECNTDTVSIEQEIAYLTNYIELQRIRKDDRYHVVFSHEVHRQGGRIAPLLLIPFVENAFKHVSHFKDRRNLIRIMLRVDEDGLFFTCSNTREEKPYAGRDGGIGLENVKKRLNILYPGRHILHIEHSDTSFHVDFKIVDL